MGWPVYLFFSWCGLGPGNWLGDGPGRAAVGDTLLPKLYLSTKYNHNWLVVLWQGFHSLTASQWPVLIYTGNTRHSPDVVSMLGQRRRRWANIETTSGECLVFAGIVDNEHKLINYPPDVTVSKNQILFLISRLIKRAEIYGSCHWDNLDIILTQISSFALNVVWRCFVSGCQLIIIIIVS